jgi:CheY-like chemotaxis protein
MAAKFLGISFEPSRPIIPFSNRYRVRAGPCSPSSRPFSGDRTNELAQPETNTESWKKVWDQATGSAYVVNTVITRYMSPQQIKDEIDKLNQVDKTEIFRWLDVQAHTRRWMDYKLPDGSGLDAARRVRSKWGDAPIIIISGYEAKTIELKAEKLGISDFLEKPFSQETICNAMEKAIASLPLAAALI